MLESPNNIPHCCNPALDAATFLTKNLRPHEESCEELESTIGSRSVGDGGIVPLHGGFEGVGMERAES